MCLTWLMRGEERQPWPHPAAQTWRNFGSFQDGLKQITPCHRAGWASGHLSHLPSWSHHWLTSCIDFVASPVLLHRAGTSSPKPIGTYSQQYRYIWWSIYVTLQIEVREHGQEPPGLRGFSMYLCVGEGQDSITKFFQSVPCGVCNCLAFVAQRTIWTAHAYTHVFLVTYLLFYKAAQFWWALGQWALHHKTHLL